MTEAGQTGRGAPLATLLDWEDMVHRDPGVLSTGTRRLQMTYQMVCRDTEQMEPEERAWYLARMDEVFKLLGPDWAMDADWWHEPTTAYPDTDWDALGVAPSTKLVDSLRRVDFEARPRQTSTLFLTLSWAPPTAKTQWLRNVLMTKGTRRRKTQARRQDVAMFVEGHERFIGALAPLVCSIVPLDADGLCTYLQHCISWDRHAVQCPDYACNLDSQLGGTLFVPGRPPVLGEQFVQPLTIKTWQKRLRTGLPAALSKVPFPCRAHVRWQPMGLREADAYLTWSERKWATSYKGLRKLAKQTSEVNEPEEVEGRDDQDSAIEAGQSVVDQRKRIRQGLDVLGWLKLTVLCWAPDEETLADRVKVLTEVLFQQGLVVCVEGPNASIEWLACVPGHVKYGLRAVPLATSFLTALLPHTHMWHGQMWNTYLEDEPLLMLSTDGAPFGFSTHVGALGHLVLAGPSRTGKSGWLGGAIPMWFRYRRARACVFDRDNSLKVMTIMHGGQHYALGAPGGARLHILGRLDTEADRQWAAHWIEKVLNGEGLPPDPDERREIWKMIHRLAGLPRQSRTLTMARTLLQVQRLKVGLEPFCEGGEYAFCDGGEDTLAWDSRLLCFEMSHLLTKPHALYAVLSYCDHQLETLWFTGDPVLIAIDEAQWLAEMDLFLGAMDVWLLARAKKNVSVWISIQNIAYLATTKLWQTIINNVPTKIMLPNPNALSPDVRPYYEALQVPGYGIEQIAMAQPFRDYLYSSPLGTRMTQSALSPSERLQCAASSMEELAVFDAMLAEIPRADLPAKWLRHWGYHEHARYLEPVKEDPWFVPYSPSSEVVLSALASR